MVSSLVRHLLHVEQLEWLDIKRFKQTHSKRTSRRADQKFTWIQRGLFLIILTAVLTHLPKLPHLISPTYPQDPSRSFFYCGHSAFLRTVSTWPKKLRLSEYGASL